MSLDDGTHSAEACHISSPWGMPRGTLPSRRSLPPLAVHHVRSCTASCSTERLAATCVWERARHAHPHIQQCADRLRFLVCTHRKAAVGADGVLDFLKDAVAEAPELPPPEEAKPKRKR